MQEQLSYLKSVIEGAPNIEPWSAWISQNTPSLEKILSRTEFLNLKLHRIKAIPAILDRFKISFEKSERYQFLGGIPGRCKECGVSLDYSPGFETKGGFVWCHNGCFRMHVLTKPNQTR
jgi:hypothetical protein